METKTENMEFKGTKGRWEINPKAIRNVRCRGITVANTSQGQSGDNEEEEQANALLISKAPELLNALIRLLELTKEMDKTILDIEKLPYADLEFLEEIQNIIKEATEIN